jgi:putative membrane protein
MSDLRSIVTRARWARLCLAPVLLISATNASAHEAGSSADEWFSVFLQVGMPLLLTAGLYIRGLFCLWRRSGRGHGVRPTHALAFGAGWIALALSLLSPLDTLGGELFAVHMVQHEVLMLVAAPLLVLGRPLPVFLWAFPSNARAALARAGKSPWLASVWQSLTRPLAGWALHALALWIWHAPPLFEAALVDRGVHNLQHISFVATALLFWTALFQARARESQGAAILYLFTTTVHSSVLGALLTFAARPWYPSYLNTVPQWGLSALEDQQLGGLIMWVPASFVYIGIALVLLARWINASGTVAEARSR